MVEASPSFPAGEYTVCITPPICRSKVACAAIQDSSPVDVVKAFHTESTGAANHAFGDEWLLSVRRVYECHECEHDCGELHGTFLCLAEAAASRWEK